jgi:tRNA(Ile)-lysidine synthase
VTNLLEHVEQSIRERKLLRRGERVLVAVSGGVDSMVLLHLLRSLAAKHCWKLFVAHFNHQLRGRSSDADERLVRKTAGALDLPYSAGTGPVGALAKERGQSIEMVARELRHAFIARTATRLRIRTVALAHHADDQVELFFVRLLRGAGGEGIAGMKWCSPSPANVAIQHVRPLLDLSRADLEQFARENKIRFREDASNAFRDALRNRIRHELLPLLRGRFQPALNQTVLRLMEIVGAEAQFAEAAAQAWLTNPRSSFEDLAIPVARRVLQLQLQRHKVPPDFDLIESLRLSPGKPVALSPTARAASDTAGHVSLSAISSLAFKRGQRAVKLEGRAGQGNFGGLRFCWRIVHRRGALRSSQMHGHEVFDTDKIGARIVLRYWRAGDRFRPIGMRAEVKLQDWFMNRKIPREHRHELVVATNERDEVFWIEDQRIGDRFKLTPDTKRRLIWSWERR